MTTRLRMLAIAPVLLLAACVTVPAGPSVSAMPGTRKSWDQFQADDASCRGYAASLTGTPGDAAAQAGVGSAVAGTIIGAAIGGLVGGGEGAAVGAGLGLFSGSVVGAGNAQAAGAVTQQRFDSAYYQCMYGLGNRVPAPVGYMARNASAPRAALGNTAPPNAAVPPPNTPPPSRTPPPNAAIPPPNTPPPYQLPR
jgi:hypothetical protein